MARKNRYEFRPDKQNNDILGKLLLTRQQFSRLLRWLLLSAVCLTGLVLQDVVMSRFSIFDTTTDLVPCGIFLICLLEGTEAGCVFSLIASCLYLFSGSAAGNFVIVLITVIAFVTCMVRQSYFQAGFGAALICTLGAMLLFELSVFSIVAFFGQTYTGRIGIFLLTALYSWAVMIPLYPLACKIGKIGGEPWKE